ncbi:MAG: hypothetical protein N2255_06270, partial [Kiritimatiellae bacterium]|nr:hypothetical protein [Kiritimatiellia bacterium]
ILGLMILAFLPYRIEPGAAVTGFLLSSLCLALVMSLTAINFLLWPVIGNSVCFLSAIALNPFWRHLSGKPKEGRLHEKK